MGSRRALALSLALLLCGAAAEAAPQGPSPADREQARALMEEGKARRDRGDLKGALEAYKAADAIMHVPTTGFSVAKTLLTLGKLVEARDTALIVTRLPVAPNEPTAFADARKAAEEMANEIAPRVPTLRVQFKGVPDGLAPQVLIDDAEVPYESLLVPRRLNPGHHVVVARLGDSEKRAEEDLAERDAKAVTLEFPPDAGKKAAAAAKPQGGKPAPGGEAPTKKTSPLVYVGIGLGGAGLAVGAIGGVVSLSNLSDAKTQCVDFKCPPQAHDKINTANTWAWVSNVGFIAAGVGAALVVVGLVSGGKTEAKIGGARVQPVVSGSGAGVAGTF